MVFSFFLLTLIRKDESQPKFLINLLKKTISDKGGNSIPNQNQRVSEYKNCKKSTKSIFTSYYGDGDWDRVSPTNLASNFDKRVTENYADELKNMQNFLDAHIYLSDTVKIREIVQILLYIVECDDKLQDLYVLPDGEKISKKKLLGRKNIHLSSFLLGLWHYIVIKECIEEDFDKILAPETLKSFSDKFDDNKPRIFNPEKILPKYKDVQIITNDIEKISSNNSGEGDGECDCSNETSSNIDNRSNQYHHVNGTSSMEECSYKGQSGSEIIEKYLNAVKAKYSTIKTFFYENQPVNFYDFYIENDVLLKFDDAGSEHTQGQIISADISKSEVYSNFLILIGTSGIGKTTMLRHLILSSVERYEKSHQIPVFITCKDYLCSSEGMVEYIYKKMISFCKDIKREDFDQCLQEGKLLILFDGLDELKKDAWDVFVRDLNFMIDQYGNNRYIVSSRPLRYHRFISFEKAMLLYIEPFKKEQGVQLIENLHVVSELSVSKEEFIKNYKQIIYDMHKDVSSNPFFLTLMVKSFIKHGKASYSRGELCQKIYADVYSLCCSMSPESQRALKSGLDEEELADCFSELCANAYRDGKGFFTRDELSHYIRKLSIYTNGKKDFSIANFIHDITISLCLMDIEDTIYSFQYKILMEYFCARYYYNAPDDKLNELGMIFEQSQAYPFEDWTCSMLYDMDSTRVEEKIILPFLKRLLKKCDDADGYWTFLEEIYPTIDYCMGNIFGFCKNTSPSFLYHFIMIRNGGRQLQYHIETNALPFDPLLEVHNAFIDGRIIDEVDFVLFQGDVNIYDGSLFSISDANLAWFRFDIKEIRNESEKHRPLLETLSSKGFALECEYCAVRKYMEELEEKYNL